MRHKHADLIKAWAEGAEIEYRGSSGWGRISNPTWNLNAKYRVYDKFAALKKAHAAGADIEFLATGGWVPCWGREPAWDPELEYRVKPATTKLFCTLVETSGGLNVRGTRKQRPNEAEIGWLADGGVTRGIICIEINPVTLEVVEATLEKL